MKNTRPFAAAIVSALRPIRTGRVIIEEIIFEPSDLNAFLAARSISLGEMRDTRSMCDWSLDGAADEEIEDLLTAWTSPRFVGASGEIIMISKEHDHGTTEVQPGI
jgi:hypothetical protein